MTTTTQPHPLTEYADRIDPATVYTVRQLAELMELTASSVAAMARYGWLPGSGMRPHRRGGRAPGKFSNFYNLAIDGRGAILSRRNDKKAELKSESVNVSRLRDRRFNGYLRVKIPHPLDDEVEAIVKTYVAGSAAVREGMANGLNAEAAAVLSAYGQRMASVAIRTESLDALRRGVVAVALAEGRLDDYRDNLFVLSTINDSASLLGTDLGAVIDDLQSLLPSVGRESLRQFDQYRERDKRIEAFGIRRSGSGETFLYV